MNAEYNLPRPGTGEFFYWRDPEPEMLGETTRAFLQRLPGPTHLHLSGRDNSRCRAIVTLLHGNEPSGLHAVHTLIRERVTPIVDTHIFIASVDAARQGPGFVYRMLPEHKDLNRCFKPPYDDSEEDQLALTLLNTLKSLQPECVIDIHNTSGSSPSFGVTTFMDKRHDALVSLFTHRMIVTDIALGALMEISETLFPTVTIECGGAEDPESNLMAIEGLQRYLTYDQVLTAEHGDMTLEFFHNPVRLELNESSNIAYGDHSLMREGVTLLGDIEKYNFGFVDAHDQLGFVGGELGAHLRALDPAGRDLLPQCFRLQEQKLYPARRLKLFMVTTNPEIARKDCLFYFVEEAGEHG